MNQCTRCKAELPDNAVFCPACGKKQIAQEKRKSLKRANGTGTVYKLQGRRRKPWVAAKNKVIIGYYERKTDALEALEKLSGKSLSERYNMSFADVFKEWKQEHYRNIAYKAISAYERAFVIFKPLHDRRFRDLRTADFQTVIDAYLDLSYSTLSKHKQLITQMSKWAIREELITTNFATFVQLPKKPKQEKAIFSDEDIAKLERDGSEAAMIVLMLIYTGMRIGALFSLPLADYHGAYLIGGEKTDAGRNRIIPIRPEGRRYFAYFAKQATGDLLLSGYTGHSNISSYRTSDYYPLLERLHIERKTPHSTRHTFASWAAKNGVKPEVLQKILGHSNYTTTADIYIHSNIEQLVRAVEIC